LALERCAILTFKTFFRGSVLGAALSAVDIALWDIKGQHHQAPIWDLLGGNCRNRIRLHLLILGDFGPEAIAAKVGEGMNLGFTAVKFDPIPVIAGDSGARAIGP
jgi:galactonate dehydratase